MTTLPILLLLTALPGPGPISTMAIQTSFALPASKVKEPVTDDSIRDDVMVHLASDPVVKGGNIEVDVKDGVVTIKGAVDSDEARHRAEKLAKKVKGVKSVVNQLTIKE